MSVGRKLETLGMVELLRPSDQTTAAILWKVLLFQDHMVEEDENKWSLYPAQLFSNSYLSLQKVFCNCAGVCHLLPDSSLSISLNIWLKQASLAVSNADSFWYVNIQPKVQVSV